MLNLSSLLNMFCSNGSNEAKRSSSAFSRSRCLLEGLLFVMPSFGVVLILWIKRMIKNTHTRLSIIISNGDKTKTFSAQLDRQKMCCVECEFTNTYWGALGFTIPDMKTKSYHPQSEGVKSASRVSEWVFVRLVLFRFVSCFSISQISWPLYDRLRKVFLCDGGKTMCVTSCRTDVWE